MNRGPFSENDLIQGEKWLKAGKVSPPLFSEGTYQVEVKGDKGPSSSQWPFLQINDEGQVVDAFCTCGQAETSSSCPHLAAAYLKIYNKLSHPLHIRYRESLWNQLCQMASHRHGYDTDILEKKEGGYRIVSNTGKVLFFVKGTAPSGKKKLQEILFERAIETEETSLKFSNLSADELQLWKQGNPSHQLRFELSFWSDLAKWWMSLQDEGKPYEITFKPESAELPNEIHIQLSDNECTFYVARANWSSIIPALTTVKAPLSVHEFSDKKIESIAYDRASKSFSLELQKKEEAIEAKGQVVELEGWTYVKGKGFFPSKRDEFFQESIIEQSKVSSSLDKHTSLFRRFLKEEKVHEGSYTLQYELFFSKDKCLHIQSYVFERGDLKKPHSAFFGHWVYIEDKGFYRIENSMFPSEEMIIEPGKVSDFINKHRSWLNLFEGFQTHLMTIESEIHFFVDDLHRLCFESHFELIEEKGGILDFADWVYLPQKGFFPKQKEKTGSPLVSGLKIAKEDVALFIRKNREDLKLVPSFFSIKCPVESLQLDVALTPEDKIRVRPYYVLNSTYHHSQVFFFGDYTYVDKEGFAEIPYERPLLDAFLEEKVLDKNEEAIFVFHELDVLRAYIRLLDPRLKKADQLFLRINEIKKDEKAKEGKWVIDLEYESEHGRVDAYVIWEALQNNQKYLYTSAGLISLKHPRFNWLKSLSKKKWLKAGKQVRLSSLEWIRLNAFEELKEPKGADPKEKRSLEILEEFRNMQTSELLNVEGLKSDLRGYQETGLKWLWFLYCNGISGLLCDEMGLGKTHQAMALLAAVYNAGEGKKKFLVVCPTSVIYHWEDLLQRFFPKLRVCVFYGLGRTLETFEEKYDLILTSYGTLRSEKNELSEIDFEVAVYDEVQNAKNSHSQTHKSLRTMKSVMRLGLTGTPLENRLLELKALFDVVLPTYLPTETHFKEFFVNPIEKSQDEERKHLLARIIRPFILRRKKSEVLLELPEKIEEISYCDLSEDQKKLYKEVFFTQKEMLIKELSTSTTGKAYVHIFSVLSKLKQICDHPVLANKDFANFHKYRSGKWDLFVELLQEARESNQKVVVFTQYLDMMDMIEAYLKEHNIGFAEIRGSSRHRKEALEEFKLDPKCEVFVASLQAAGVGIDLTSASVVIHYDRWWNPAKENQATDRVHRIGQNRGVQVFKLVTKKTVEERIHELIGKKMELFESVIGFDDQDHIKGLSKQELIELLRILEQDLEERT